MRYQVCYEKKGRLIFPERLTIVPENFCVYNFFHNAVMHRESIRLILIEGDHIRTNLFYYVIQIFGCMIFDLCRTRNIENVFVDMVHKF